MKCFTLCFALILVGCGKEAPKSITLKDVKSATLGGWESGCLPMDYADTPIEGVSSVRWQFEVTPKEVATGQPEVNFRQVLYSDGACVTALATVRTQSWAEIEGNDDKRFTLKMETYSTYITSHTEALMKRFVLNEPEIIAKHLNQEYFAFSFPYDLDRATFGKSFLFGGETSGGSLTLFPPSTKQFSGEGSRQTAPQIFQKPVPMHRRY